MNYISATNIITFLTKKMFCEKKPTKVSFSIDLLYFNYGINSLANSCTSADLAVI